MYGRYVAKRFGQSSVLGSYLDPLADKVLIGSVVAALGYQVGSPLPGMPPANLTQDKIQPSSTIVLL